MEVFSDLTDGSFPLLDDLIPLPIGSVFGTASRLRGDSEILMDFIECPDDVHALMRFLTDAARDYNAAHAAFMEKDPWCRVNTERGDFLMYIFTSICASGGRKMYMAGEDHVSNDMFSEEHYLEFIFPYQKELLQAFPEWYVHSCGNLTPLFKHIAKLPNLNRVHVSPWSNLEAGVEALGNSVVLEIHHPLDFDEKSGEEIDRMADHLVDVCGGTCTVDIVLLQSENGKRYKQRILRRIG
jgi:uroporphyrinogen-III decarboxylase